MTTLPALPNIDRLSAEELARLVDVARDVGVSPAELAVVIYYESAGTWDPRIKNPTSSASGLLQWIESTAKSLGTTTAQIREMSRLEQLELARKYLGRYRGRMKHTGDVYIAVFSDKGLGHGDEFVIYKDPEQAYLLNAGLLDRDKDGAITNGDIRGRVKATLAHYPHTVVVPDAAPVASAQGGSSATGLWVLLAAVVARRFLA